MKRMRDESGQTVIMVALCLTCILGFVGFATDVGVLLHAKRNLQIAADAAALAGANEINIDPTKVVAAGTAASAQNGVTNGVNGASVTVTNGPLYGPNKGTPNYIEAIITQPQPTFFIGVLRHSSSMPVTARAVAFNGANNGSGCLNALNSIDADTIDLQGHAKLNAPGCQVIDNSKNGSALDFTGNAARLTAGFVGVVGGVAGFGSDSTPPPVTGIRQVSDPLANTIKPLTAAQKGTCAPPPSGNNWAPATAGGIVCYSGNISIKTAVSLAPGTYVFTGSLGLQGTGSLTGGSGATGTTNGVTLYLAAPNGNMDMSGAGSASINLTAGSTNYPGVVIYEEPLDTNKVNMEGTPITTLSGIIYLPSAMLELGGNGNLSQNLNVDLVVNKFFDFGNADVNITDYSATHNTTLHTIALVE